MTREQRGHIEAWIVGALIGIAAALLVSGCAHPAPSPGEPPRPGLIACGSDAITACAPKVASYVIGCLDGTGDVSACLWAIPALVGCAGYEVIACATRREGAVAEHAAQAEGERRGLVGGPSANWRRAARAKDFLARTGAKFNDEGSGP